MPSHIDLGDARPVAEIRAAMEGRTVVAFTGAGVSAESGVPTFRGPEGLWKSHNPEDLATPGAFARDPELVWEWYRWRRRRVARCRPNPAHMALAREATRRPLTIVTQNVDGLHAVARRSIGAAVGPPGHGPAPIELHGSLFRDRCTACRYSRNVPFPPGNDVETGADAERLNGGEALPLCPSCGQLLRPDVVWYGEALDQSALEAGFRAAHDAAVCLVIGTSGVVYPAAHVPLITHESGGLVIEVNPAPTALSHLARFHVAGAAAEVVPALLAPSVELGSP